MSLKWMALDVGSNTIGIALSDPTEIVASPVEVIRREGWKKESGRLEELISTHKVEGLVLGLPIRTDGTKGPEAEAVEKFGRRLVGRFSLPTEYWDERFSTVSATQSLIEADVSRQKRKQVVDAVAAAVFLQTFLDHRKKRS